MIKKLIIILCAVLFINCTNGVAVHAEDTTYYDEFFDLVEELLPDISVNRDYDEDTALLYQSVLQYCDLIRTYRDEFDNTDGSFTVFEEAVVNFRNAIANELDIDNAFLALYNALGNLTRLASTDVSALASLVTTINEAGIINADGSYNSYYAIISVIDLEYYLESANQIIEDFNNGYGDDYLQGEVDKAYLYLLYAYNNLVVSQSVSEDVKVSMTVTLTNPTTNIYQVGTQTIYDTSGNKITVNVQYEFGQLEGVYLLQLFINGSLVNSVHIDTNEWDGVTYSPDTLNSLLAVNCYDSSSPISENVEILFEKSEDFKELTEESISISKEDTEPKVIYGGEGEADTTIYAYYTTEYDEDGEVVYEGIVVEHASIGDIVENTYYVNSGETYTFYTYINGVEDYVNLTFNLTSSQEEQQDDSDSKDDSGTEESDDTTDTTKSNESTTTTTPSTGDTTNITVLAAIMLLSFVGILGLARKKRTEI